MNKCRGCTHGDCFRHVDEYVIGSGRVLKCQCPDPKKHHGKLPWPKKPHHKEEPR